MSSSSGTRGVFRPTTTPVPREDRLPPPPPDGPRKFQINVDFPTRMAVGALQTIRVELTPLEPLDRVVDLGRPLLAEPMPVRLIIPGALVTPPEQGLDPSPFEAAEAVFHVTPLATGELAEARTELLRGGRLDLVPMPMRCHSRVLPWLLAALTLLLPLTVHALGSPVAQQELLAWLPNLKIDEVLSRSLADAGQLLRQGRISFFTFLGLSATTLWLLLARRPHRTSAQGEPFALGPPPRHSASTPPSYLTPVSDPEVSVAPKAF